MCLEDKILSAYVDGEIEAPLNVKIKEHVDHCPSCRDAIQDLVFLKTLLQEDAQPDCRASMNRLMSEIEKSIPLERKTARVSLWQRKIKLPVPLAATAALLILAMGFSLLFLSTRPDLRQMSIKRGPMGTTEVHVAAPIEDLELLLKSFDDAAFTRQVIISLPKESQFIIAGEPILLLEADFTRRWE